MNLDRISAELGAYKFAYMTSEDWSLVQQDPDAWREFASSWDRLAVDNYMRPGDNFRHRRFCKYRVHVSSMTFHELEDFGFHQSPAINSYAGGLRREFAPVEPGVRRNRILKEIAQRCLTAILRCVGSPATYWNVYVHQFRIHCDASMAGHPTPEGTHRDGHDFISMHLINRHRVRGGVSTVFDDAGRTLKSVTLTNHMETLLLNDRALLHGVSAITPSTAEFGYRDMLVIDYNCGN